MPICEKRFMYEMTASFTLSPDTPGKPRFDLPHKVQEQHRGFFPQGQPIDEACGQKLAAWARGGTPSPALAPPSSQPEASEPKLFAVAREKARAGREAFEDWRERLTDRQRDGLQPIAAELDRLLDDADARADDRHLQPEDA
ncbi:conserved hypothetical protein [Methylobacterium nodulans ORS 2060]|uniref:Uncharacterized protein n=2 Tax=Methylobacterium nodulans TaxID=114616 RepID=B8IH16_METNO|nr:conserved hypothetical protein [Methylobacterium nodulans ORS 2060]